MTIRLPVALPLVLALAAPIAAQSPAGQRFEVAPGETGVTRLDTQTGAVSRCRPQDGAWTCEAVAASAPSLHPAAGGSRPSAPVAMRSLAARLVDRLVAVVGRLKHPHAKPPTAAAS